MQSSFFLKKNILLRWNWWLLKIAEYKMRKTHKLEALFEALKHDHRKCGALLKFITHCQASNLEDIILLQEMNAVCIMVLLVNFTFAG